MKILTKLSCALAIGLLGTMSAQATTICNALAAAGAGTAIAPGTPGTNFNVTAVNPKCSANVYLVGVDGTGGGYYTIGSASAKGKNSFKANTNGGGVAIHAACTTAGACLLADATAAQAQAVTDATASSGGTTSGGTTSGGTTSGGTTSGGTTPP